MAYSIESTVHNHRLLQKTKNHVSLLSLIHIFLDEATSHLDVHCEQRVNAAIRALRITRVMVAHRPETIASADRVIVLGQGKVSLDESTARLAERQAAAAREQA